MEVLGQSIDKSVLSNCWKPVKLTRKGPFISHMFYADDLLLLGETSFAQARVMKHVLATFCGISGQRMNRHKSHI